MKKGLRYFMEIIRRVDNNPDTSEDDIYYALIVIIKIFKITSDLPDLKSAPKLLLKNRLKANYTYNMNYLGVKGL